MPDIVNAIRQMQPINAGNVLAQGTQIQGLQARNALIPEQGRALGLRNDLLQGQLGDIDATRNALASGDINALAQVDPAAAAQLQSLNSAQTQQAMAELSVIADRVATSKNPAALFSVLKGSPQVQQLSESLGIDLASASAEGLSDDDIRADAESLRDSLRGSGIGGGRVQSVKTDEQGNVFAVMRDATVRDLGRTERNPLQIIQSPAGIEAIDKLTGQPRAQIRTQEELNAAAASRVAAETAAGAGGLNLSPGQLKVDAAFADDYVAWQAGGGFADVEKNVAQVTGVQKRLEAGENLTGAVIGNQPRALLANTNPEALDALEQVEEVVQRNLRLILGAQFTEREGERLIARAYNPRLPEEMNAKRLGRLQKSLLDAAKAKDAAAKHYEKNGTLAGFTGTVPTINTITEDVGTAPATNNVQEMTQEELEALAYGD